jgi:23S rRNA (pseudouridine1915-N3)-methyltransferase
MRVIVAAVGRLKQGAERDLAGDYRRRAEAVGRSAGLRQIEVVEIRESHARDAERRRTEESIAIANLLPEDGVIVAFDQTGNNIDSPGLAALLQKYRGENRAALCFVIGGADGITSSLRGRARHILAFGAATWPHQLVRIMLLEQLYRAGTILAGHPYHRG